MSTLPTPFLPRAQRPPGPRGHPPVKHTFFLRHVTAIFGNGLLTSEGDFWLRQRRLAAPAFHPDRIAGYGIVMASFADRLADRWRPGEVRDVYRDLMRVTMEIVSKTLFARRFIFCPGSSIAIRDGSRSPNVSAPSAGSTGARRGCQSTSSFPSAADRASASASASR